MGGRLRVALGRRSGALSAGDLELLAISAYMLGPRRRLRRCVGARLPFPPEGRRPSSAARCTWWIGDYLRFRGDSARATGWFARGHRLLDRVRRRLRRARLSAAADHSRPRVRPATMRPRSPSPWRPARSASGFGDRDLIALAMMEQGHALVRQGRVARGPAAGRRDDGGGHHGGAVAGHRRHRLLQHDRVLSGRVRAGPGSGVDGRPYALVRAPVRHGRLHGPLPRAPRRDHDLGRCLVGCDGRRSAAPRATRGAP